MAQSIQRLRYFDGEYLRSNDFTDEQFYHVAMRRRLNQELHLSGIVEGLEIQQDANSVPPTLFFYSINTGFAIDQLGREILVSAPYELSSDNVLSRAGLQEGANEVWIVYTETASGLPAPGYQLCDQPGQNTRWTEFFDIRLRLKGAPPSATGDDPNTDLKGVMLGHVNVANDPINGWMITNTPPPDTLGRTYVGIRAQSIVTPDQVDADTSTFTNQNITPPVASAVAPLGYLDVGGGPAAGPSGGPGVLIRGNMFTARNLVVGDDYLIQNTNPVGTPALKNPNGNLKLNSDLFLQGTIYTFDTVKGNWIALKDYISSLVSVAPDVRTGYVTIPIGTSPGATTKFTQNFTATTNLTNFHLPWDPTDVSVSIAAFETVNNQSLATLATLMAGTQEQITADASFTSSSGNTATFTASCTLTPNWNDGLGNQLVPLVSITLSYVVIFRPGP